MSARVDARPRAQERGEGWLAGHPERVLSPLVFVLAVGGWEAVVRGLGIPAEVLPTPSRVGAALVRITRDGSLLAALGTTLQEICWGFLLGSSLGFILGVVVAVSPRAERLLFPYIVALQATPKITLAPLLVIWFGYGILSKVLIAAVIAMFPVVVNTVVGLRDVDPDRVDLLRAHGANGWQIFRLVQFPGSLPYVFAALDLAIIFSLIGAIVGEFVGADRGLGFLIIQSNFHVDLAASFAVLIVLGVLGLLLHFAVVAIQKKVVFWAPVQGPTAA